MKTLLALALLAASTLGAQTTLYTLLPTPDASIVATNPPATSSIGIGQAREIYKTDAELKRELKAAQNELVLGALKAEMAINEKLFEVLRAELQSFGSDPETAKVILANEQRLVAVNAATEYAIGIVERDLKDSKPPSP